MPLSQLDRRVHKKVPLHNDPRARDLPECRWVHCAPTSAWRDMAPSPAAAFRRPFPARYRLLCGPRPRNPQRVAGEYDNQQSARPQPKFVVNHSFNRAAETNGSHHSFNIRSMTPKFRPQLVPDVAGQQPRGGCVSARPRSHLRATGQNQLCSSCGARIGCANKTPGSSSRKNTCFYEPHTQSSALILRTWQLALIN